MVGRVIFSSRMPYQRHVLPCPFCFTGVVCRKHGKGAFTTTECLKHALQIEMNMILGIFDPENNTVFLRCEASPPSGGLVGGRIMQHEKWNLALHRQNSDNHRLHLSLFWKEEHTARTLHKYTLYIIHYTL